MPEFVERMLSEEQELSTKLTALDAFTMSDTYKGITPNEQAQMAVQRQGMHIYLLALRERCAIHVDNFEPSS